MSTKIHKMKYPSIIFLVLFALPACKKEKPVDYCTNSLKDIGETGVDCGGTCKPCELVFSPNFFLKLNQTPVTFNSYTFSQNNNDWFLSCFNDSIQMYFNVGPTIDIGNYLIKPSGSFAFINGISYPLIVQSSAVMGIYENFTTQNRISGLFNTKFYRAGFVDTMHVSSGEFVHLPY